MDLIVDSIEGCVTRLSYMHILESWIKHTLIFTTKCLKKLNSVLCCPKLGFLGMPDLPAEGKAEDFAYRPTLVVLRALGQKQ